MMNASPQHPFRVFLRGFLSHPVEVSSIIPTSRRIARRLADFVPAGKMVIVEYGPGTGFLARALLESNRLSSDSKIILIEKSSILAEYLRQTFTDERVHVFHDSADRVKEILQECEETAADFIFTSIPLTVMPETVATRILTATASALKPHGQCIVFLFRSRVGRMLRRHFCIIKTRLELFNFPPLVIFQAIKKPPTI